MSCLPHFLPTGSIYHPRSDSRILKESDGDHAGHGLRTPNEASFSIEIQNFWAWADQFGGFWGIFTVNPLDQYTLRGRPQTTFTRFGFF